MRERCPGRAAHAVGSSDASHYPPLTDRQDQPGGADSIPLRVQKTLCPPSRSSGKVVRASANLILATEADGEKGDGHVFRNLPEATDGQLQGPTGDKGRLWKALDQVMVVNHDSWVKSYWLFLHWWRSGG